MPITNRPDPDYKPENQQSFSDGEYTVNGISWVTKDESGAPIFKVRKNSASLYAVYRTVVGEKDGPPGSVSPAQVSILVRAFGGDPEKLPDKEQDPTAYLLAARDLINNQNKKVKVIVRGGWVQEIPGMSLPVDKYFTFEIGRFTSKNEMDEISWVEGDYGPWFGVEFVAVGNMYQKPTPYDGVTIWDSVGYGLAVDSEGNPTFATKADGQWTSAAVGISKFISAFIPEALDYEFSTPTNILPELWDIYRRNRKRAVTQVIKRKSGRVCLNISGLVSVEEAQASESPQEVPARDVEDEIKEDASLEGVYALISEGLGKKAFDSSGSLNKDGKAWCKENLKPFLVEKGYPASFSKWTAGMVKDVFEFLSQDDEEEF